MRYRVDGALWTVLAAALVAGLVWADPGVAQQRPGKRLVISDLPMAEQVRIRVETAAREDEAGDLFRQARQSEQSGDWGKSARLYEESAELRADGDHLGAMSYELAGRAYFFDGKPRRASRMWEEAGNRALIVGDVIGSARNYLHAAVAANENGDRTRAVVLGWKAYRLTESELLSSQERDLIRQHLQVKSGS